LFAGHAIALQGAWEILVQPHQILEGSDGTQGEQKIEEHTDFDVGQGSELAPDASQGDDSAFTTECPRVGEPAFEGP
jgi:hypothetical protein